MSEPHNQSSADLQSTLETPAYTVEEVQSNPRVYLLKGFLTDAECDHFIQLAQDKIEPSTTVDPDTGKHIVVEARSSSSTFFYLNQTPIVGAVESRIAELIQIPVENGEGMQVLNYQVGQCYNAHFDYFDPKLKGSPVVLACGGQRVATCLMYLNHVEGGGETHFPEVDYRVTPNRGDAILFYNILADGEVDPLSLHASLPVTAGEKWVATKWVREREYRQP